MTSGVVCTGGRGAAEDVVAGCADPRLVRLGRVPDADRNGLIAAAVALVFPSTYEGFGAPLIEAMTLGTPIVCSDAASLPEVAGDAAVVRPPTLDAWADARSTRWIGAGPTSSLSATGGPSSSPPCAPGGALAADSDREVWRELLVLCPHFAPDTVLDGRRDDPHRPRAGRSWPHHQGGHGPAVVPGPRRGAELGRAVDADRADPVGGRGAGPPVPRKRQAQPGACWGTGLCRVHGAGRPAGRHRPAGSTW